MHLGIPLFFVSLANTKPRYKIHWVYMFGISITRGYDPAI